MEVHDIRALMKHPPGWAAPDGSVAFWKGAPFNDGATWIGHFSGQSPWERHPDSDELLHVLEGEVEITVLTDREAVRRMIRAGSVFVVPRGLRHRQSARGGRVVEFGVTPGRTEYSGVGDPRRERVPAAEPQAGGDALYAEGEAAEKT